MGSANDLDTAKADFKAAWEALKARTSPEQARGGLSGHEHSGRRGRWSLPRIRSPGRRAPDAAHFCADHLAGLSSGSLSTD